MTVLSDIRNWLARVYAEKLNLELKENISDDTTIFWNVSDDDSKIANLFDADLGIWFKFICLEDAANISSSVEIAVQRSLTDLSQLLHRSGVPTELNDPMGAWTISLIFVMPSHLCSAWEQVLQLLRAESGFTEELAIDRLVYRDEKTINHELSTENGLSQLLFASRSLLELPIQNIESWLSADNEVRNLMERLPSEFVHTADKELVDRMIESVSSEKREIALAKFPLNPKSIGTVNVRNMRNVSNFSLDLRVPGSDVHVMVLHGPNGTGKSSIFEGLSFAVAGNSERMERYLSDKDILRKSVESYLDNVLTPLDLLQKPSVTRDGEEMMDVSILNQRRAEANLATSEGNLLAQEDAREFVQLTGEELGGRVLRGYSSLAQSLQAHCEREYQAANSLRQDWLRKFGIIASITKAESRFLKLVDHFIAKSFPQGSQQIFDWLSEAGIRFPARKIAFDVLVSRWGDVDGKARREQLAKRLFQADSFGSTHDSVLVIQRWIEERDNVLIDIKKTADELEPTLITLAAQRSEIAEDLASWHTWLIRRSSEVVPPSSEQMPTLLTDALAKLNERIGELKNLGQGISLQQQHLKEVEKSILPSWVEIHPNLCPTCNTDHHNVGGIAALISQLHGQVEKNLLEMRRQYSEALSQIREIERQRNEFGECPLSEPRRLTISHIFGFAESDFLEFERVISVNGAVDQLLRSVDTVMSVPRLPISGDSSRFATGLWKDIETENARGAALWDLPDRWNRIRDVINEECMAIVQQHLPRTLESVWTELAMALTPARWNLAGQPRLTAETKRGAERLRVVVGDGKKDIHVRHIFNEAENHVLGLAWFFTRYLSSGRFRHTLIALDDPAQEMDQTTFRSFTRWIQVLCRLHMRRKIPLSVVLFLHQEDRALDAARATNHQVTALRWAKKIDSSNTVEHLVLLNPEFSSPLPKAMVLSQANSTSLS